MISFTSVTPENSRGINCVILKGPMVMKRGGGVKCYGVIVHYILRRRSVTESPLKVDSACTDCPEILVLGGAGAPAPSFF